MKKFITLLIFSSVLFAGIQQGEIKKVMEDKIQASIAIISKNQKKDVTKELYALLDPIFDYKLMARLSLGKEYKKLTKEQRAIFSQKFEQRLKNSFADKLKFYSNQKIKIGDLSNVKSRKVLHTTLSDGQNVYPINYKFYRSKDGSWLIYDVEILDTSIIQTYRNQFMGFLDHQSFKQLLDLLENTQISTQKK